MLGSVSNNISDVDNLLAQLEACQDRVDDALVQSDFEVVIDLSEARNFLLASAKSNRITRSFETDVKRLADLKIRVEYSINFLKERMKDLGVDTGRRKRALIGYRNGV